VNVGRFEMLRDRHAGQRGVIVANGPSLNRMDLSFLKNEIVIGLNKIYLGFNQFGFYPRYYVAVNPYVIEQSVAEIRSLKCVKFISNRSAALVAEDALTYHINTTQPPERFCHDIVQGVHEGWTVTYAALQVARFLGFDTVVLIGLDHYFQYQGAPNELRRLEGADHNHFHPDYFGHGQQWNNPDLAHSEESYRVARAEYEREGRRILDATIDGGCQVFDKVDYKELFLT
jgi:hypothetical protein